MLKSVGKWLQDIVKDSASTVLKMSETIFGTIGGEDFEEEPKEAASELEIDDSLPPLERIKRYIHSELILHRLYLVRELGETAAQVGCEAVKTELMPVLRELTQDGEPVIRQALGEQLPDFTGLLLKSGQQEYKDLAAVTLLGFVAQLSADQNPQVRKSAQQALGSIAEQIKEDGGSSEVQQKVLPIIINLSQNMQEEDLRVDSAALFNTIAHLLGAEAVKAHVLEHINRLSDDPVFRVRKSVASNINNLAKTIGTDETVEHLLPLYLKLSTDEIWGVRKACAESLVVISEAITPKERTEKLVEVFMKLAKDSSRWVRSSAFQCLGPFIATFEGSQVTPKLLEYYINMANDTATLKFGDSDAITYCAYNFPAVLLTIGKDRWQEVSGAYFTLVKDLQWKVRRTLSHSLHEIAKILGTELTESSLLSTFELFLKDLDEVKVGVMKHIASFLEVLTPQSRENYLPILQEIQKESPNWRFRKLLAKQLGKLATIYNPACIRSTIIPMAMALASDHYFNVRTAAITSFGVLLASVKDDKETTDEFIAQILALPSAKAYARRQLFLFVCDSLVGVVQDEVIESLFLEPAIGLAADKVPNVRFALARFLSNLVKRPHFTGKEHIRNILTGMLQDKDKDVLHFSKLALATINGTTTPPTSTTTDTTHTTDAGQSTTNTTQE